MKEVLCDLLLLGYELNIKKDGRQARIKVSNETHAIEQLLPRDHHLSEKRLSDCVRWCLNHLLADKTDKLMQNGCKL